MRRCLARASALAVSLVPAPALAHTGIGHAAGFVAGFTHPLGGPDHFLAMLAVGLFAWQLGGRALWLVPASFMTMMAVGGALGIERTALPFVETAIAASVVVLGALVAFRSKASLVIAMMIVGLFALFHGHAHGAEMPLGAAAAAYVAGLVLATAVLHGGGIALGVLVGRAGDIHARRACRLAGASIALAGLILLPHSL